MNKHEVKDIEKDIELQLFIYDLATRAIRSGTDIRDNSNRLINSTNKINELLDRLDANEIQVHTEELH